jgi:DNA-binding NtrC family response regulator
MMKEQTVRFWFYSRDRSFAEVLGRTLGPGYEICQGELEDLRSILQRRQDIDAILLDAFTSGSEGGDEILQAVRILLKSSAAPPPIIAMVHDDEQEVVRTLIENGADETLAGPPDIRELRLVLGRAHRYHQIELDLAQSRLRQQSPGQLGEMAGCSESIQQVFEMARKVAACDVSVLVMGETGTGKELLARAVHRLSTRAAGPFVPFSCANLPEPLIDDELFGHEKGAFTGAICARRGRFEAADRGTVFLDEIADLAPGLQAKLLRVLQERSFERLGSNTPLATDVRVVCATHQNLEEMVQDGRFRMDLYFRLNVVQIRIPPLRERREDIPLLAQQFLGQYANQFGKQTRRVSQPAMRALEEYSWPGNVRELENVIQRAVVLSEGQTIEIAHLPEKLYNGIVLSQASSLYEEEVQEFKRRLLLRTLRACKGNRTETARLLGVTRGCLHRLINHLSIREQEDRRVLLEDCRELRELPVGAVRQ